jgi:hypothetical protein
MKENCASEIVTISSFSSSKVENQQSNEIMQNFGQSLQNLNTQIGTLLLNLNDKNLQILEYQQILNNQTTLMENFSIKSSSTFATTFQTILIMIVIILLIVLIIMIKNLKPKEKKYEAVKKLSNSLEVKNHPGSVEGKKFSSIASLKNSTIRYERTDSKEPTYETVDEYQNNPGGIVVMLSDYDQVKLTPKVKIDDHSLDEYAEVYERNEMYAHYDEVPTPIPI